MLQMLIKNILIRWWAVILFVAIATFFTVNPPYTNTPPIRADGLGYHAWTRAILDHKLSFCKYRALDNNQSISAPQPQTGKCINKYPPGLALLRFPFMAPSTAHNNGQLRSETEDTINQVLSILAGSVAVLSMVVLARQQKVSWAIANAISILFAFGMGLFHYATYDSSFTHVYSAAFIGILCICGIKYARAYSSKKHTVSKKLALGIAVSSAILVSLRNPLLLVVLALGAYCFVNNLKGFNIRSIKLLAMTHKNLILYTSLAVGTVLFFQLAYNTYIFGHPALSSYSGEQFSLTQLKQLSVMFSVEKGVFLYFPVMIITLVLCAKLDRKWLLVCIVATLPLVVLYGSWHAWELGGGFGNRGFVELAPIYATAFASAFSKLKKTYLRSIIIGLAILAAIASLGLMRSYWLNETGYGGASDIKQLLTYSVGSKNFVSESLKSVTR